MNPLHDIAARVRSEANIADRPGQYGRLMQIADDIEQAAENQSFRPERGAE